MSLIALNNLPKLFREQLNFIPDPPSKRDLTLELTSIIEDFFSKHSLELNKDEVSASYSDIPVWRIDTVLAKLRSLLELKAKKEIRIFCANLEQRNKKQINTLLREARIYTFREALDLDLYVGVHTAISAYFKMIGVALVATANLESKIPVSISAKELFKSLRFIATLPLRHLMAVDGLFWDSKQYTIPTIFNCEIRDSGISYSLPLEEIETRLKSACADEAQSGCPALRARTTSGVAVFDLVENYCVDSTERFFLNYPSK